MALLLASGVALAVSQIRCDSGECLGTPRNDEMLGFLRHDVIYALKGDDRMWGRTGGDDVYGFNGNDWATGGSGIDKVSGGDGRDTLLEIAQQDSSRDTVNGGNGSDTLISRNDPASVDILNCGAGYDIAEGGQQGHRKQQLRRCSPQRRRWRGLLAATAYGGRFVDRCG